MFSMREIVASDLRIQIVAASKLMLEQPEVEWFRNKLKALLDEYDQVMNMEVFELNEKYFQGILAKEANQ